MAFTSTDLTAVEKAIQDIVTGKKRVIEFAMPDGRIERYNDAKLTDLLALRDRIKEELNAAELDVTKRRPRIFRARHQRGL